MTKQATSKTEKPANNKLPPVLMCDGSKGGVGKSMLSFALTDAVFAKDRPVLYLETDTANADTLRLLTPPEDNPSAVGGDIQTCTLDLDTHEGWMDALTVIHDNPHRTVIVNMAARQNKGIASHGNLLVENLEELQRELRTLWVINRESIGLEILLRQMDVFPATQTNVVRNGYFGAEDRFTIYNSSNLCRRIADKGGHSVTLPVLADRLKEIMVKKHWSVAQALSSGTLGWGEEAELKRWRRNTHAALAPLLP